MTRITRRTALKATVAAGTSALAGCAASSISRAAPITVHGQLGVKDGKVVDQDGDALSIAGPSLFWHNEGWARDGGLEPGEYYNATVVRHALQYWNAPIIRAAIGAETEGGYIENPDYAWRKLTAVADAAIENGMYCIVDWHTHHGEQHTDAAIAFFTRVATRYAGRPNIIYEIYNEPLPQAQWRSVIKPYATRVIAAIRAIDPLNLIVVGTSSWSQDVDIAAQSPITNDPALAYALHFYAATHHESLRDKARIAIEAGLPLFVTEWGAISADGDGAIDYAETSIWMDFLREHQLSHCNWSLHSKREGASILKPNTPADATHRSENLTETGRLTTSIIRNWHPRRYA